MPSRSKKQHNFMAAVANNPKFAKKTGVPQSVGEEYLKADKGHKFKEGGKIMKNQMKIDAAKVAKTKANQEKKAALDAKKQDKKAQVDKKIGKGGPKSQGTGKVFKTPESKSPNKDGKKSPLSGGKAKPGKAGGGKGGGKLKGERPSIGKKPGSPVTKPGPDKKPIDKKPIGKKPVKDDMMSKPIKQPVVKKPTKDSNPYKDFMDREKSLNRPKEQEGKKQDAPVQTLKRGGMACKKYARGGSVSSRADGVAKKGRTKGKFI